MYLRISKNDDKWRWAGHATKNLKPRRQVTFQVPHLWCDTAHSLVTIPGVWLLLHTQTLIEMDDTKNEIQIMYELARHTQINHMDF